MTLEQALAISATVMSAAAVAVTALVPRWSDSRQRRLDRYADAVKAVVAWVEFPYRVARRVSDDESVLAELAAHGHDLQERLAYHAAWTAADNKKVGRLYGDALSAIKAATAPALRAAWTSPPASEPVRMNVGSLGIDEQATKTLLDRVHLAARHRFGLRRLLGWSWRWALPTFNADVGTRTLAPGAFAPPNGKSSAAARTTPDQP